MPETYQIVFLKAGDGSPTAVQTAAEKISNATKTPLERILKQIQQAPFVYKKGLPKSKADNIAAALNKLGGVTEVRPDSAPEPAGPGSGGSFGATASGSSGGFDFSTPSPPPAATPALSGGFDFGSPGGPAPSRAGDDFSIESDDAARPPPAASGGFDFSPQAAVTGPAPAPAKAPRIEIERNEDFAPAAPAKAPPVARKPRAEDTVVCPRCQHQQPPGDECASCGVVLAKAGSEPAPQPTRRPRARAAAAPRSKVMTIAVTAAALIVAVGAAWITGLLNPLRLRLAVGGDAMLSEYGVSVAAPSGKFVTAQVSGDQKANEILETFVAASANIQAEIDRLSSLSDLAEYEAAQPALQGQIGAYQASAANTLLKRVGDIAGRFYAVGGVGLSVGGKTYSYREMIAQSGLPASTQVEAVLNEVDIRQALKTARERVVVQQAARLEEERRREVNVSFRDRFANGLGERWQRLGEPTADANNGRLRLIAQNQALATAGMVTLPEPVADYTVEVTIMGSAPDASRAGLVVFQGPRAFIGVVKTRAGRNDAAQVITQAADGYSAPAGRDVRVRLERRGANYLFFAWDSARNHWAQLDRLQPAWADQPTRQIGLTGYNGSGAFDFADFSLAIE